MMVRRTLPHRDIRMIGAFCFIDHYGPTMAHGPDFRTMIVPPHPHTGLQTVSWLVTGEIDHRDSVGSIQRIQPGALNLMTAGSGIAHSEYSRGVAEIHGVQLWVALPEQHRHQDPHFEHHASLPGVTSGPLDTRVLMGSLSGVTSPAATYSPLVCAELLMSGGSQRVALDPQYEHGVLPLDGDAWIDGTQVPRGALHYTPPGQHDLALRVSSATRLLLVGGVPFDEHVLMWWNFVGRDHEEIVQFREDWQSGRRFGSVTDDDLEPLAAPELPTVRLKPRPRSRS
jgi:redox-sensitive bicupin YhaK (pirin superfamily)